MNKTSYGVVAVLVGILLMVLGYGLRVSQSSDEAVVELRMQIERNDCRPAGFGLVQTPGKMVLLGHTVFACPNGSIYFLPTSQLKAGSAQ